MNDTPPANATARGVVALPRQGAFVIQIGRGSRVSVGEVCGRIEHIAAGKACTFHSLAEMLAFVTDTLRGLADFDAADDASATASEHARSDTCKSESELSCAVSTPQPRTAKGTRP